MRMVRTATTIIERPDPTDAKPVTGWGTMSDSMHSIHSPA